ncbi:nucleotide sugar dehydrogenase [Lentisalinibacter orientalis]|uniref:nucleotide sugar dehydrogenase n=1 Tax=Lentisalinibacter orientalis TaxID=2992241 RepID=UPI00386A798D
MKISIFGMGYVGAVSFGCLARDGHEVIGVDIDPHKLELLDSGQTPIIEAGMEELIRDAATSGRTSVTTDAAEAIAKSELSFVCVGTPSTRTGGHDLTALRNVAQSIGKALGEKSAKHTVVIRSTVAPGTTEDVVIPILEDESGKKCGEDFEVCFQPEFLREGSSIRDYDKPPFTVAGGESERSVAPVRLLFEHLPSPFVPTTIRTAEMLKFCCNVFHALKIDFANEVGRVCDGLDVDARAVMELLCMDTQLNISTAYLKPGLPFGGSCLPKDVRAMVAMAQETGTNIPVISAIMPSNAVHVNFILNKILEREEKTVAILGLSFKDGTDDLRESPLVELVERLIGKGFDVRIYDREVNLARLVGANKRFINETIPHVSSLMQESLGKALNASPTVIVGQFDEADEGRFYESLRAEQHVIDLTGRVDRAKVPGGYEGATW